MIKQLEGLFAELSATIYGLPLVVWRIGRSPVRGAVRLYVQHRRKHDAHIGPHSAVLLTAVLISFWSGRAPWPEEIRQLVSGVLTGESGLTEPIVTSVILAALIDGGCRVCARLRYARDLRRRSRAVAMLLYAASFGLVAIGPLFWLALMTSHAGLLLAFLLYAAAFAAGWPMIAVYNALRRTSARNLDVQLIFPFAVLIVFTAAPALGGRVVRWITTPPVVLSFPYTTCTLEESTVGVVAVLRNHTREAVILDSRNLGVRLTVAQPASIAQVPVAVIRSSLAMAGGLITIPPDGVGLVEATADPKDSKRIGNDLTLPMRPERCELVKMNEQRPLWLGERDGERLGQDGFEGSGTVLDRR